MYIFIMLHDTWHVQSKVYKLQHSKSMTVFHKYSESILGHNMYIMFSWFSIFICFVLLKFWANQFGVSIQVYMSTFHYLPGRTLFFPYPSEHEAYQRTGSHIVPLSLGRYEHKISIRKILNPIHLILNIHSLGPSENTFQSMFQAHFEANYGKK